MGGWLHSPRKNYWDVTWSSWNISSIKRRSLIMIIGKRAWTAPGVCGELSRSCGELVPPATTSSVAVKALNPHHGQNLLAVDPGLCSTRLLCIILARTEALQACSMAWIVAHVRRTIYLRYIHWWNLLLVRQSKAPSATQLNESLSEQFI